MAALRTVERYGPITAVLFDFHRTLVDGGDPYRSMDAAWTRSGRPGTGPLQLGAERWEALVQRVYHLWDRVREVDPGNERDLSPKRHREIFGELMGRLPDMDEALAQGYYDVMPDFWMPYSDSLPTLLELKRRGVRLGLLSNVARNVRPILARGGMLELFDTVTLSFEVGVVKPDAAIFQLTLDAMGAAPADALMVGDNPFDDGGAAVLGVRTFILPRTEGTSHGLDTVTRIVG